MNFMPFGGGWLLGSGREMLFEKLGKPAGSAIFGHERSWGRTLLVEWKLPAPANKDGGWDHYQRGMLPLI